jgi:hypothetical protein
VADNVAITAGVGTSILTDDCTTGHAQIVKLAIATDGSATLIPADATNGIDVDVTRLPGYLTDTFGKLNTVGALNDIDVQFFRDDPANLVTVTSANGGTATRTTGLMQLATSTATNGSITTVSRDTVMYRSGGEVFVLFTTAFLDGGVAGCNQRIGLFDANNGFFVGYEGTSFGIVARTGGVDGSQVAKASWNGDQLTAAAGSRYTRGGTPEAVNFALLNVWRLRFGWLGAAPVKLEILSPDGEWVVCHTIRQPNLSATPSIQSTDLPMRAELVKTSGATTVRLNTACWGAGVTYTNVDIVGSGTLGTAANSVINYQTQGTNSLLLRCSTSTTGTAIIEGTANGADWVTMPNVWLVGAAGSPDTVVSAAFTPTAANVYRVPVGNMRAVRVRTATTLGAGTVFHVQGEAGSTMVGFSGAGIGKVEGGVAHDGVDAGPPVKVGMRAVAHGTTPTAVAAADRTDWYANRAGIPFVMGGHPNIQSAEYFASTAATDDNILPAISAGTIYVITCITVACSAANATTPSVRIGFGTTTVPAQGTNQADAVGKVVLSHPGIPAGSGIVKGNGSGIVGIGGDGEELRITCTTPTTSLIVQVDYYTIAS